MPRLSRTSMRNQVRRRRRLAAVRRSRRARPVARKKGGVASIVFEHGTNRYADGVEAVRDMNLAIADGELMILVGPSGSGKSTALRMVAGLEDVTRASSGSATTS
jgi:ABC-type glutathione transport system ATPase component